MKMLSKCSSRLLKVFSYSFSRSYDHQNLQKRFSEKKILKKKCFFLEKTFFPKNYFFCRKKMFFWKFFFFLKIFFEGSGGRMTMKYSMKTLLKVSENTLKAFSKVFNNISPIFMVFHVFCKNQWKTMIFGWKYGKIAKIAILRVFLAPQHRFLTFWPKWATLGSKIVKSYKISKKKFPTSFLAKMDKLVLKNNFFRQIVHFLDNLSKNSIFWKQIIFLVQT